MPLDVHENLRRTLDGIVGQYELLGEQLADPTIATDHRRVQSISIRRAAIEPLVERWRRFVRLERELDEATRLAEEDDAELAALAREELPRLRREAAATLEAAQEQLVTADEDAVGAVILEIRAGVGGDEAGLFAGDLVEMYSRFAAERGWRVEMLDASSGEAGGFKQAILSVKGPRVFADLAFESGTHQVKRVPATEAQGRVHTSTATVAVLPEPEEIEVDLDPADVKESITTAQGPGGQNVNKVATAVHLIHQPTGIEVRMQETKSQQQNRERAWQLLRARLFAKQQAEAAARRAESRNSMIGSASRAEKIRTYRFKENIVADHRLGESFNLSEVLAGTMAPMIDALRRREVAARLAAL
ncbi:MAG: peptide chain release factor 1 [Phycisphaerales bacterium]